MRRGGGGGRGVGGGEWGQCINKLVLRDLEAVLGGGDFINWTSLIISMQNVHELMVLD